jgi:hypothetical protein
VTLPRPPRWFIADDILAGRVDLDAYPFTFIYVTGPPNDMVSAPRAGRAAYQALVDRVFSAAELLEARGWQVVNFEGAGPQVYLRRLPR